ncbi:MAG: hypothetical protein KA713_18725 [Chryseotalea sp. WA131a]|nr:MAG: hypothetical protein KA713_18725 [Chryseotalea sp. WA131a]
MKNPIKLVLIVFGILLATSCGENSRVKPTIDLTYEEKQDLVAMSDQFNVHLQQKATFNFAKTAMQQQDKASFMLDYMMPILKGDQQQLEVAKKIIGNLFSNQPNNALRTEIEDDFFKPSPAVAQLTENLTADLTNVQTNSDHGEQSTKELVSDLKSVITDFKRDVQNNTSLTFDEARALLAFAEFENNSITETVNLANALHADSSSGRTQCFFSNLLAVVITAVVAAVVVVSAVATGGAMALAFGATISAAKWGTIIGVSAIVGGAYGAGVGYYQAYTQGGSIIKLDFENPLGGFLEWQY